MPPRSMQVLKALRPRRPCFSTVNVSHRVLSTSAICLEEDKSSRWMENPKGVPLALELDGITIDKPEVSLTFSQRLALRKETVAGTTDAGAPAVKSQRQRNNNGARPFQSRDARGPRDTVGSATQSTQDGRGSQGRPAGPNGQRPAGQGAQRRPPQNGKIQSAQARQSVGGARTAGQGQGQGQRGQRRQPGRRKMQGGEKKGKNIEFERVTDPELNDYPSEERNEPPSRRYSNDGFLMLKGKHVQINPVVRPTLPKFGKSSITAKDASKMSADASTLRVLSYVDRAPPKPAADSHHNLLGVIDNASLALSRVRDLDVPRRRDALSIVEKMAGRTTVSDKQPAGSV